MYLKQQKNGWSLFILLLAGIVLGGFIGKYVVMLIPILSWLNYGKEFGLNTITLDLNILVIRFGFNLYISIASILGILVSSIVYKKL